MRRSILAIAVIVVVLAAGYFLLVYQPEIEPLAAGQAQTFDPALVARGSALAAVGDCASCHTLPGGPALAGGVAVPTPFGTIYASNITPDPETGIGRWSEAAFIRAMQEGVNRRGSRLYPAFPFDHFTHISVADDKALYAYLMTRDPVKSERRANNLAFPFNLRPLMAGWDLLFLHKGELAPDPDQSAEWNRGRYLVDGLGHCGACHTPRNSFGAEDDGRQFAGGSVIDGWYVYPINASSPAPTRWDADSLATYLRNGFAVEHGVARGPMAQVTARLHEATDGDVHAMAVYVASLIASKVPAPAAPPVQPVLQSGDSQVAPVPAVASADERGSEIFSATCSSCHDAGRQPPFGGIDLHKSTAVNADSPQNIVNMVLFGYPAAEGRTGGTMPGFSGTLGQDDVVSLLGYLRATFSGKPQWPDAAAIVADTMSGKTVVKLYGQDGVQRAAPQANGSGSSP